MTEPNELKKLEQTHLNFVRKQIGKAKVKIAKTIQAAKSGQKELEKDFYNDVRVKTSTYGGMIETGVSVRQQQQMLMQKENRWQTATRDLKTLQKLDDNSYFARVDVKEASTNPEKIYIGLASFTNPDQPDEYLIYDWRAPISSVYYDSGIGEMTYNAPMGKQTVDVSLKREIQIKDGIIKNVLDTDEAVGDPLLLENLSHQSNTKMKSIVATIQQEQNTIIRDTDADLLFVQGVAGSGKTAAVLQRVAYLLYRYRGNLNPGQLILFSPNQLFNDYINQVLPELGEQNMVQMTYYQFMSRRVPHQEVETLQERFEAEEQGNQKDVAKFKNSLAFFDLVQQYANDLNQHDIQFKNIVFQGKVFFSSEQIKEIYYDFNDNYSLRTRLEATKETLMKKLNHHIGSEMKKRWVEETIEGLSKEDLQMIYAKYGDQVQDSDKEYKFIAKKIVKNAFKPVAKQIMRHRFFSINKQFAHLLHAVPNYPAFQETGLDRQDWKQSITKTITAFQDGQISMGDVSIYLYLFDLVTGKRPDTQMRYLFIDEVQDYSPFQLAYLKWNYPRAKFTLLGDLNQAIFTKNDTSIMNVLKTMFDPEKIRVINLLKSYRSTQEITNFSKGLIEDGQAIESFSRSGSMPVLEQVENKDQGFDQIKLQIEADQKQEETTAIIGKTLSDCKEVAEGLEKRGIKATLIRTENQRLVKGAIIVPAYLAKGLEFDSVIMWNGSAARYASLDEDKLIYTICTRAMHSLKIIAVGQPAPIFTRVPKTDYDLIKE